MKTPKYLDEYDFRARFVPSIIVTLPIISAIIAVFPPARQLYGLLIGPILEVVLVLVLVRVARDEGKKIEPQLIKEWGGLPTTRYSGIGTTNSKAQRVSATKQLYLS